jgi:hypothetical protein
MGRHGLTVPAAWGLAVAGYCWWSAASSRVARCPTCEQVLLRLVRGPGRAWLDLRDLTCLQLPVPDQT